MTKVETGDCAVREVVAGIVEYHRAFAAGDYKGVVAKMGPGMTVYAPNGVLQSVPEGDKDAVLKVYEDVHQQGARLCVEPRYIEVTAQGDMAVATFMMQGFGVAPGSDTRLEVVRRITHVWSRVEGQWMIAHIHASNLDRFEDFGPLALV